MCTGTVERILRQARGLLRKNDCLAAVEHLELALVDLPDEGRLWDLLGVALWDSGAVQDAVDALEQASMLVPLSVEGQLALALGYEVAQRRELATDLLVNLAARDCLTPQVMEQLARALGRAGELPIALQVCERAARLQTDSPAPLLGIAYYMARLGATSDQIVPVLIRALHLDPNDNSVRILLARRLHDCGLTEDAAEVLRVSDPAKTACPNCLYAMHQIFEAAGDHESTARCYELLASLEVL